MGIGLYGDSYNIIIITQVFHILIFLISAVILRLTALYTKKVLKPKYYSIRNLVLYKFIYNSTIVKNKLAEQFNVIEYPLIFLFIITGAIFLVSTRDLVSTLLSIELQSYGLYMLTSLYIRSALSTVGFTSKVTSDLSYRDSFIKKIFIFIWHFRLKHYLCSVILLLLFGGLKDCLCDILLELTFHDVNLYLVGMIICFLFIFFSYKFKL